MFVTMNRIPIRHGHEEAFAERFRKRAGLVDGTPGFIRNLVLAPVNPGDPHIVMTLWRDRASFEAWTRSDAFHQAHAKASKAPKSMFAGESKLEMFEVVCDSYAGGEPGERL